MNSVNIIGNLTKDPQVRTTTSGKRVASFTVAANRVVGDKEVADFINVVAWAPLADAVAQTLYKGARVVVYGRLSIRTYDAADGSKRQAAEVVANVIATPISVKRAGESYWGDNLYQTNQTTPESADFSRFGQTVNAPRGTQAEQEDIPF